MTFNKIRIRDDDVLVTSSGFPGKEFQRFKGFHNIILQDPAHFIHIGAVLVTEIQQFPECIEFLKQETREGRFVPEVHGLHHIDYASLSFEDIVSHLTTCRKFIEDNFEYSPTKFYTPWGAGADSRGAHIRPAAATVGFDLVTCENLIKISRVRSDVVLVKENLLTNEELLKRWEGKEIILHWWEGVGALNETVQHFGGIK